MATATQRQSFSMPQDVHPLVMTDYLVLASLGLAALWALDPFLLLPDRIAVLKFVPAVCLAGAMLLGIVGSAMFAPYDRSRDIYAYLEGARVLAAFAASVVAGSLFAKYGSGIDNTFLTLGVFILVVPALATVVSNSGSPIRFCLGYVLVCVLLGGLIGVIQIANFAQYAYFHSLEFVVIPCAVFFAFAPLNRVYRWAGIVFFAVLAVAQHKNTGYLVLLFVIAYLAICKFSEVIRRVSYIDRYYYGLAILAVALTLIAIVAVGIAYREEWLPSGNTVYRLYTYEVAWNRFLESPLYGTLFTEAATEKFPLYEITDGSARGILPTHSDPLDVLAHGGLLLSSLFFGSLVLLSRRGFELTRLIERCKSHNDWSRATVHFLFVSFATALVTMCFNPILLSPNRSIAFWAPAALLLGLSRRYGRRKKSPLQNLSFPRHQ